MLERNSYHLDGDEEDCLSVKLAFAHLEEVLKRGAKQVHDHDMKALVVVYLLLSHVLEVRDAGYEGILGLGMELTFASQLVDQLAFPVEHDMLLVLHSFLL